MQQCWSTTLLGTLHSGWRALKEVRGGCTGGQGRVCRWSGEGVCVMQDLWERYYELFTTDDSSTVASLLYIYLLEHHSDIDHNDCNILEAIATNKFNEYISPSRLNG